MLDIASARFSGAPAAPSTVLKAPAAIHFGGPAMDTYQAGSAACQSLKAAFHNKDFQPELAFVFNASEDESLRTVPGIIGVVRELLDDVADSNLLPESEAAARTFYLEIICPNDAKVKLLGNVVNTINQVIKPGRIDLVSRGLQQTFRILSGVQGDMEPVAMVPDPENPLRVHIRVPFKRISGDDFRKLSAFLDRNIGFLERIGIGGK
jgi:hypothetical protein